jgi:mono/diheme cytochrome c family protein
MRTSFWLAVVAALLWVDGRPAAAEGLTADDGELLAQAYCLACHRVSKEQPPPRDVTVDTGRLEDYEVPSFGLIARADLTDAELSRRILLPHYPMREQEFLPEELEAIVAYLISLRDVGGMDIDW